MTRGEELVKFISILLIGLVLLLFCFENLYLLAAAGASVDTGTPKIAPPGIEDAQSFWKGIVGGVSSFLRKFEFVGKGIDYIAPFFENAGTRLGVWWSFRARPWFEYHWTNLNIYLNQEIRLE